MTKMVVAPAAPAAVPVAAVPVAAVPVAASAASPAVQVGSPSSRADVDREFAELQLGMHAHEHGHHHSFMLIIVILAAVAYAAFRMHLIPDSILAFFGISSTSGATDDGKDQKPDGGVPAQVPARSVKGSVIFEGAQANIGKMSCANVGPGACSVKVDPCKLVHETLDATPTPVCHTIEGLCAKKVVPWYGDVCSLQERGALDNFGENFVQSVSVPQGITLDVNAARACDGPSEYSNVCTRAGGCTFSQAVYQRDVGLQFGISPGFQLKCGQTVHTGPTK